MFPSTAPANGPGHSQDLNQDRLASTLALTHLDAGIRALTFVVDPQSLTLATPATSMGLALGLGPGSILINSRIGWLATMSMPLPANSRCLIDALVTGQGEPSDFHTGLLHEATGDYANSWQLLTPCVVAASAVNISTTLPFTQTYRGFSTTHTGGWGPALLDNQRNGVAVRASRHGGGFYLVTAGEIRGEAIGYIATHNASSDALHHFDLTVQYVKNGSALPTYFLSAKIDAVPVGELTTTLELDPTAVFPAFVSDGTPVFLRTWAWSNDGGFPVVGWGRNAVTHGERLPAPLGKGQHVWLASTDVDSILSLQPLYQQKTPINQLRAIRDMATQLAGAYL